MTPPLLVVGTVRRSHGLSGEFSVEVLSDFPERFAPGTRLLWRRGSDARELVVAGVRPHGGGLLLTVEGCGDVTAARALQGGELCVAETDAHPAPEGYFYAHEVRGFRCEDASGRVLGEATDLAATPAGPMLTVAVGGAGGREALVPWTHPIVVAVDREGRRIVLDPPEGLFEL
ncbi:MAG TPA: ribosome maturation factor RimM [Thermoanaerobaculia bacterium]|nr:ribosome maturation factor RimM [Thermoanaerobaculia bacterium]